MNSSTSSSDAAAWRGFTALVLAVSAATLAAVLGLAYLVDPYDTGRSTLFAAPGVREQGPRTAAASRGRDPAFNAAIIGNSHIQLLSPDRLKEKTGLDFVQLSVPATGPKEQFVLVDWFLRHRQSPARALVVAADTMWCTDNPEMPNEKPFPFWLFSPDPLEYAAGLLRFDILEELPRRLAYVFGGENERAAPNGYWDYEPNYLALGFKSDAALRARLRNRVNASVPLNPTGQFPVADKLREVASSLPDDLAFILVFPPTYRAAVPSPRSVRGRSDAACKEALRAAASVHPRTVVIDWRVRRPENQNPEHYFDQTHYREPIAQAVENDIADALKHVSPKQ